MLCSHNARGLLEADGITVGVGMRGEGLWVVAEEVEVTGSSDLSRSKKQNKTKNNQTNKQKTAGTREEKLPHQLKI